MKNLLFLEAYTSFKYELMHMCTLVKQCNLHYDWYMENICEGIEVAIVKPA